MDRAGAWHAVVEHDGLADQRFGAARAADPLQAPARKASPQRQSGAFESTIRLERPRGLSSPRCGSCRYPTVKSFAPSAPGMPAFHCWRLSHRPRFRASHRSAHRSGKRGGRPMEAPLWALNADEPASASPAVRIRSSPPRGLDGGFLGQRDNRILGGRGFANDLFDGSIAEIERRGCGHRQFSHRQRD